MRKISLMLLFLALIATPFFVLHTSLVTAQSTETPEDRKARLEQELAQYEAEIKQKELELSQQQKTSSNYKAEVSLLTSQINTAKLKIKARTLAISKLSDEIHDKNLTISELDEKIEKQKQSLAQLVRKTQQLDGANVVHLMLSSESLSGFYSDVDSFTALKESVKSSVDQIRSVKGETEEEKQSLEETQNKELDAKAELESSKRTVEKSEAEKKQLLSQSKNQEVAYQQILEDRRKKAAQIRAMLFPIRDSAAIPFGRAYDLALEVQRKTGVDPAFQLAIMTQESNLGANTGSCYLTNTTTGAGVGAKTGSTILKVMSPTRDIAPFLQILSGLGQDPSKVLVSCPQAIGWGGAMGPAQFIPSTWIMYQNRLSAALGVSSPNPWEPRDAFMASSMFLADLGASAGTWSSEWNAACKYYSGKSCTAATYAAPYGNSVMALTKSIQENQIDLLKNL